jgi:hypothetical protein
MKCLCSGLVVTLSLTSFVGCASFAKADTASAGASDGTPTLLTELQLTSDMAMAPPSTAADQPIGTTGWVVGSQAGGAVDVSATSSVSAIVTTFSDTANVEALEGSYPVPTGEGGQYVWADYKLAQYNTNDIYIEFYAKMPSQHKGGCKFIKIFGVGSSTTNLSDTTIATDYTGIDYGSIRQITFGDGSGPVNDGQNVIDLDGSNPQLIGRSYGTAQVSTPQTSNFPSSAWGTSWHHFRIHVKYNSGTTLQNEVPNGEYYLEIDGTVYVNATGLYNRNPVNGPISYMEFFGWAQKNPNPFQLWFDDIRVSTGGFMAQALPDPPSAVSLK